MMTKLILEKSSSAENIINKHRRFCDRSELFSGYFFITLLLGDSLHFPKWKFYAVNQVSYKKYQLSMPRIRNRIRTTLHDSFRYLIGWSFHLFGNPAPKWH